MIEQPLRLRIIVNPAAGKDEAFFNAFNTVFREANFDWDIAITKEAGDGQRLAQAAIMDGADMIAVYGGDGSVMDVARGMKNSPVPLGIIPGGTGIVMAIELGIPSKLEAACKLLTGEHDIRNMDMILVNDKHFLLRVGCGFEAQVIEGAPREEKDRYGLFAYIKAGIEAILEPEIAKYLLIVDGEKHEVEGIGCIVANVGNIGLPGLFLAPDILVDDGLLDVFVLQRSDLPGLLTMSTKIISGTEDKDTMFHVKGKRIDVISDPYQTVQGDGELIGTTPLSIRILPGSIRVIVPFPE